MQEVSAGGVIVYKHTREWLVLIMKDMKGNWTFPKGKIEEHEEPAEAAIREIREEVGLTALTHIAELTPVHYFYYRGGPVKKTVHYYLFRSPKKQTPVVQTEEGISEARWVRMADAKRIIGYPKTNLPLLAEARAKLT